ncbi:MAG TPA: adenylate/guanylate cyclase domain-containing protein [Verrucomicrobiae bacterium]|nr:adenylate/guanylate cyclase domain-containing protein [Verrucomicrobiae bacterium]
MNRVEALATLPDVTAHILVCLVALGMALAFISADRESPTSRWLAATFAFIAIAIDLNIVVTLTWGPPLWVQGLFAIPEALSIIALLEWIYRVRRTVPAGTLDTRTGDVALRVGQGAAIVYAVAAITWPEWRNDYFFGALANPETLGHWQFWVFAGPVFLAGFAGIASMLLLLNRRPDMPERIRVLAMLGAVPFWAASFVLPLEFTAISMIIGEVILFVGATQYHVLQGQRGQFMSRFLSPQVAELVRQRGLKHAMQESLQEITIVCCDLRGFTSYAQAHPSSQVLRVLREYYDAVGEVVGRHGATIKDFAGDGVLILVGAPLPQADHARVGVALAQQVRAAVRPVVNRASHGDHRLGIGVGVASGPATVGIVGSSGRYEYTAVGPAVNLASRLCEIARDGEVLVAAETVTHCGDCEDHNRALESRRPIEVKGFPAPVALFNVQDALAGAPA